MKDMLKKVGNLFSRKEKKEISQTEKERNKKAAEAFHRVGERYGRAITRLSER